MAVEAAQLIASSVAQATAIVERGLGECNQLDCRAEEVNVLVVLLLARAVDLDEGLQSVSGRPRRRRGPRHARPRRHAQGRLATR